MNTKPKPEAEVEKGRRELLHQTAASSLQYHKGARQYETKARRQVQQVTAQMIIDASTDN